MAGRPRSDGHAGRGRCRQRIALRRAFLPDGIGTGRQVGKEHNAVRAGGLCRQHRSTAAQQLKDCTLQENAIRRFLGDLDFTRTQFKGHAGRLQRIRGAVERNHDLLDGHAGDTDEKIGFLVVRRDGFHGDGKPAARGCHPDGIPAFDVVVAAVRTAAVAGQRAHRPRNADQVGIRGQRDGANVAGAGHAQALIGGCDLARDGCAGNAIFRKPSGVGKVHSRRAAGEGVEVIHIPVAADILRAFELLDHLAHGKLPSDARPDLIVGIAAIERHEGVGVAQHPGQRVHCLCRKAHTRNTAATGVIDKIIHIH